MSELRHYLLRAAHERQKLNTSPVTLKGYLALIDLDVQTLHCLSETLPLRTSKVTKRTSKEHNTERNKISDNAALVNASNEHL